jgi:hypothetical protein
LKHRSRRQLGQIVVVESRKRTIIGSVYAVFAAAEDVTALPPCVRVVVVRS